VSRRHHFRLSDHVQRFTLDTATARTAGRMSPHRGALRTQRETLAPAVQRQLVLATTFINDTGTDKSPHATQTHRYDRAMPNRLVTSSIQNAQ
jgi:hypothetical protein